MGKQGKKKRDPQAVAQAVHQHAADPLVRIKRLVFAGKFAFSKKADAEIKADSLTEDWVAESVMNAPFILKTILSTSPLRAHAGEKLYVIVGQPFGIGVPIYTKGTFRRMYGQEVFYVFISSKRDLSQG